jgi:WD40 repeat protein
MAAPSIFSLPTETGRANPPSHSLTVLKFNPTGDLLAIGGSDHVLKVFSFSQKSYITQKKFLSPVTSVEWKTGWKHDGFFGIVGLFIGLHNGSIFFFTFPVGDSYVCRSFFTIPRRAVS